MRIKFWTKAALFALLWKDYPPEAPVERKVEPKPQNRAPIRFYGRSKSGEKLHITRNAGMRATYECGVPIPGGIRMFSTDPRDEKSVCKTCRARVGTI